MHNTGFFKQLLSLLVLFKSTVASTQQILGLHNSSTIFVKQLMVSTVQIESQEGMIELPVDQLLNPAGTDTNMNGWTQKMKDTFHAMGGRAREASKIAYHKASESYSRVASAVRTQGAPCSYL